MTPNCTCRRKKMNYVDLAVKFVSVLTWIRMCFIALETNFLLEKEHFISSFRKYRLVNMCSQKPNKHKSRQNWNNHVPNQSFKLIIIMVMVWLLHDYMIWWLQSSPLVQIILIYIDYFKLCIIFSNNYLLLRFSLYTHKFQFISKWSPIR